MKILLADNELQVLASLRSLLQMTPEHDVIGAVNHVDTLLDSLRDMRPDLIIMDISMDAKQGLEGLNQIVNKCPSIKLCVFTRLVDEWSVAESLRRGVSGYQLKSAPLSDLLQAIGIIEKGHRFFHAAVLCMVLDRFVATVPPVAKWNSASLGVKEEIVVRSIAMGKGVKEIASDLEISVKTVETHRLRVMKKLQINNIADLTKYAIRKGLIKLDC